MNRKKYKQLRVVIFLFVGAIIALAINSGSYLLSIAAILTGTIFLILVRSKTKIKIDERETSIQEKAAKMTYAIFTPMIGISALLLLFPSKSGLLVFSKAEFLYIESLGIVFAYLALFLIAIYAISYHFLNRKYGGNS